MRTRQVEDSQNCDCAHGVLVYGKGCICAIIVVYGSTRTLSHNIGKYW